MKKQNLAPFRWIAKDELLQRLRKSVCDLTTILAELELEHEHPPPHPAGSASAVTALIGFDGAYQGLVWAHCSEPLAVRMAAGMRGGGPQRDDGVCDALGEMVNILGGEVKLFLSPSGRDVALSLPAAFHGGGMYCPRFVPSPDSLFCSFLHGGERLLVGVMMRKAL